MPQAINGRKICSKCKIEKDIGEFDRQSDKKDGFKYGCKDCETKRLRKYRLINKDKVIIKRRQKYQKNKEEILNYSKEWYETNRIRKLETSRVNYQKNRERRLELQRIRKQKPEYKQRHREWEKKYILQSHIKIKRNLRTRINDAVKRGYKSASTMELTGCSIEFLMKHLQQTAIKNGHMNFNINNYSGKEYHIDHIIPCDAFNLDCSYHQKLCFNWKNLQILDEKTNLSKHSSIINN